MVMILRKIMTKQKRGSVIDLLLWLVVSFIIVIFFAVWIYGFDQITTTLTGITGTSSVNISAAAGDTFGKVNPAQKSGLHILAFVMIFSMALSILLTNFLVKVHPAFFIVYLFIIIAAVITSVYLSNQYENLMSNTFIGPTVSEFTGGSFIMLNLPIWTTVIGIFGMIFLFSGILRDQGQGGGII